MEEFYVGQTFEGVYPPEAAQWCNNNDAYIDEIEAVENVRRFEIKAVEQPTLEEIRAFKYAQALSIAKEFIEREAFYRFDEENTIEATDGNIGKLTAYALGFQTGAFENVTWTSKEDNVLMLGAADVMRILTGLGAVQANVWNEQFIAYKAAIENAQTVEEVQAIVIKYE